MSTQTHFFHILPDFLLTHLLTFLHPKDLYLTLPLTSRFFNDFISLSNYLKLHISLRSLGISLQNVKTLSNLSDSDLQTIFLPKFQNFHHQTYQDIPFYGFYTDGGVDSNSPEYWVDTLFIKGSWSICSKAGQNFHIKGVLDENFEQVKKALDLFHELNHDFRKSFFQNVGNKNIEHNEFFSKFSSNFLIDALQEEIEKIKRLSLDEEDDSLGSDEEYFPNSRQAKTKKNIKKGKKNNKRPRKPISRLCAIWETLNGKRKSDSEWRKYNKKELIEKIAPSMNFLRKTEIKWKKVKDSNEFEIYDDKICITQENYAIIKGFEISRKGIFTCPVRTCMVFISDYDIEVKQVEIFEIFKNAKSVQDILSIYQIHGEDLPSIYHTNCPELAQRALIKSKLVNCDPEIARFVIFNNNERKMSRKVRPIAWLQFLSKDLKGLKVKLDDVRLFGGLYVIVKLIDCENRMVEFGDNNEGANIDINYVSFFGDVVNIKKMAEFL